LGHRLETFSNRRYQAPAHSQLEGSVGIVSNHYRRLDHSCPVDLVGTFSSHCCLLVCFDEFVDNLDDVVYFPMAEQVGEVVVAAAEANELRLVDFPSLVVHNVSTWRIAEHD
jgi:hypothetical protein